jgi:protocatechuate 3,4-dioxygenase beta subunit
MRAYQGSAGRDQRQVLTRSCPPVERALVDLWHVDERGEYDNGGFRFMSW